MGEYIVYEERYFCFPVGEWRGRLFFPAVVMRANVEIGGDPTLIDQTILVELKKTREANESDCETFKIKV